VKDELDATGYTVLKMGFDGWPDRLVLLGNNKHRWIEFKRPGGKLRKVQERRIEKMLKMGETVDVLGDDE
jgi:hypothetical protein